MGGEGGGMQTQAHLAMVPHSPAPTSPTKDGSSEVNSEVAKRLKDLEQRRKSLEQALKRQPTELERATKAVLTGAGPGKVFNPLRRIKREKETKIRKVWGEARVMKDPNLARQKVNKNEKNRLSQGRKRFGLSPQKQNKIRNSGTIEPSA